MVGVPIHVDRRDYAVSDDYANDIPLDLATRAHSGTSFVPDDRGRQVQEAYSALMRNTFSRLFAVATEKKLADEFLLAWGEFRAGYRQRVMAHLGARSRCLSTMIAGPSRFNARRASKASDSADARGREAAEFWASGMAHLARLLHPERRPIMSGDGDAVGRLRAKITAHEARHTAMLDANKRVKGTHQSWEVSNSGAELRRLKAQLQKLEALKARPVEFLDGEHGKVEIDPPDNRVRLFLLDPTQEAKATLKNRGFRWAPSLECWSAYCNDRTIALAKELARVP